MYRQTDDGIILVVRRLDDEFDEISKKHQKGAPKKIKIRITANETFVSDDFDDMFSGGAAFTKVKPAHMVDIGLHKFEWGPDQVVESFQLPPEAIQAVDLKKHMRVQALLGVLTQELIREAKKSGIWDGFIASTIPLSPAKA